MKTEFYFGREYAEFLKSDSIVALPDMVTSSTDIPDDDYRAMVDAGIENPNAREYWRGFNSHCKP